MSIGTGIAIHVLLFVEKHAMFLSGNRNVTRILVCLLVSVLNLIVTVMLREKLR
jgi:hypothetical protein